MLFFKKNCRSHLPLETGKYVPGALDVMTEYDKKGIFVRLYYPTELKGKIEEYSDKWIPWIPGYHYIRGFSQVVMIWILVLRFIMWLYSGVIYIPVVNGAKPKQNGKMKCIILSHGLGTARFFYSTMCADLASKGFLVAAIEHRDESSCSTYYYSSEDDAKQSRRTFIEYARINFGDNHLPARIRQVKYRSEECVKLINLMYAINEGRAPKNVLEDVESERTETSLAEFHNCLDLSDLTMMGHSFGGATSLLTLSNDVRLKQGILLDPWMFSIKDEKAIFEKMHQPLLFINTQTFHIATNVNSMEKILLKTDLSDRQMYTLLHTTHESQCDSPFVWGYWLNWFMKKLNPLTAIKINNCLVLRFLNRHIGYPAELNSVDDYLLSESHNIVEGLTKPWS